MRLNVHAAVVGDSQQLHVNIALYVNLSKKLKGLVTVFRSIGVANSNPVLISNEQK